MIEKKYLTSAILALFSVGLLSGCSSTHTTKEVTNARPGDGMMTCMHISHEFASNEAQLKRMMSGHDLKKVGNVMGGMEMNPAKSMMSASERMTWLHDRNALLYKTSAAKKCPALKSKLKIDYKTLAEHIM